MSKNAVSIVVGNENRKTKLKKMKGVKQNGKKEIKLV